MIASIIKFLNLNRVECVWAFSFHPFLLPCYPICKYILNTWRPSLVSSYTKFAPPVMTLPFPSIHCNQCSDGVDVHFWKVLRGGGASGVRSGFASTSILLREVTRPGGFFRVRHCVYDLCLSIEHVCESEMTRRGELTLLPEMP